MTSCHSCTRFAIDHIIEDAPVWDVVSRVATAVVSDLRVYAAANVVELIVQTLVVLQTTPILDSGLVLWLHDPYQLNDVVSRVVIEFSALEQVVVIHSGMAAERAGHVNSEAKPMESFPWLSKALGLLCHDSIFVNECGNKALCSSESQGDYRLEGLGSLLGLSVGPLIGRDPNMPSDPLEDHSPRI
ncbi:hypothetical protein TNCV_2434481 [Trichonephila clavipes]|nr:hypothetical protein TNCV_2434481 [Trichonephila clavipes]